MLNIFHLSSLQVYTHFDTKHETATLLESRAEQSCEQWFRRYNKDQNEDLLDSMRYFIEAAEVHSSIDAGNKTRKDCAQASLLSLQICMPDFQWLDGKHVVFGKVMDGYSVPAFEMSSAYHQHSVSVFECLRVIFWFIIMYFALIFST